MEHSFALEDVEPMATLVGEATACVAPVQRDGFSDTILWGGRTCNVIPWGQPHWRPGTERSDRGPCPL